MIDPVPWFVAGANHSASVARSIAHKATSGAEGVGSPIDLRVTQLPAPTSTVRVSTGTCVILNSFAFQESYVARAPSITDLAVTPTGSASGRSDMLVCYVDDPEFTGRVLAPGDVALGPYVQFALISGVGALAKTVPGTFGRPAIPLARIDMPTNTATVTQLMITDLRQVANPKRTRDLYNTQPVAITQIPTNTTKDACTEANRTITVPSWATQAKVICTVAGLTNRTNPSIGFYSWQLGALGSQQVATDMAVNVRTTHVIADTIAIPSVTRGTPQVLKLQGYRSNLAGSSGILEINNYSTVLWDVEFLEVASAD